MDATRAAAARLIVIAAALASVAGRSATPAAAAEAEPLRMTWTIDSREREALVFPPSKPREAPAPLVFGFHGHGGTARSASRSFHIQTVWPEAIVVYMQGIPTPGVLTDKEGKRTGWQSLPGNQDDRDLKFFDAVLATVREKYKVDGDAVYSTGHSNGGAFTYLLWGERPAVFAAMAPSAAAYRNFGTLKPKPAIHIAGEKDPLVKFAVQQRMMNAVRAINGCHENGVEWARDCTLYASPKGAAFVAFVHPGTHAYSAEAPALIVRFFKEHRRNRATGDPDAKP